MRVQLAPLDGSLQLSLSLPAGARSIAPTPLDLTAAPGVELDLQSAWLLESAARVEVACVKASADRWVAGLEGAALDGASAMIRKAGGYSALTPHGPVGRAHAIEQDFVAHEGEPAGPPDVLGRHVLGFAGEPPQISLCSLVCVQPSADDSSGCSAVLATYRVRGHSSPPPPGTLSRAAAWAAAHPPLAAATGLALALAVLVVLLRYRSRPAY